MKEKILKKYRTGRIYKIILIIIAAVTFIAVPIAGTFGNEDIAPFIVSAFTILFLLWIVYMGVFGTLMRSVSLLEKTGNMDVLDDCFDEQHILPKSKIYYGKKALYSKKPFTVMPYSEIAWVYGKVTKTYGITTAKTIQVRTKSGKEFTFEATTQEFDWLLQNCILKANPHILVGFSSENQKAYNQFLKDYNKKNKD